MSYYLIIIIAAAILSFYLAIYNEKKFQKKLNKIDSLGKEVATISNRLKKLNNNTQSVTGEVDKIFFQQDYGLIDFQHLINRTYRNTSCSNELKLAIKFFQYGKKIDTTPMRQCASKKHIRKQAIEGEYTFSKKHSYNKLHAI